VPARASAALALVVILMCGVGGALRSWARRRRRTMGVIIRRSEVRG
jgi:hypothetical protein